MKGIIALSLSTLLAGCASAVITKRADTATFSEGVTYSIPKQNIEFSIKRSKSGQKKLEDNVAKAEKAKKATEGLIATNAKKIKDLIKKVSNATDNKAKLELDLELAKLDQTVLKTTLNGKTNSVNSARKALDAFKAGADNVYADEISIKALPAHPDPTSLFVATIPTNWLSSETVDINTTEEGLLSGGTVKSEGQLGEIFVTLAKAYSSIDAVEDARKESIPGAVDGICEHKEITFKYEIDLSASTWRKDLQTELTNNNLCYQLIFGGPTLNTSAPTLAIDNKNNRADKSKKTQVDGLIYPRKNRFAFHLYQHDDNLNAAVKPSPTKTFYVDAINPSALANIPFKKGLFATNDYDYKFSNGLLTQYKSVRPNELLAALSAIPKAAKELVAIPAELIKFRVDYSTKETEYYAAQKAVLKARLELEDAQEKADNGTLLDEPSSDATTD